MCSLVVPVANLRRDNCSKINRILFTATITYFKRSYTKFLPQCSPRTAWNQFEFYCWNYYVKEYCTEGRYLLTFLCWWSWELWPRRQTKVFQTVPQPNIVSSKSRCLDARRQTLLREAEVDRTAHECLWFSPRSLHQKTDLPLLLKCSTCRVT